MKKIDVKKILCYFSLVFLTLIVFFFRFKNLDIWGLSGDEIVTGRVPNFDSPRCYIYGFIVNNFARLVIFVTGRDFVNEIMLRLPSAMAAMITIPVLWGMGKRIKDEITSLILITLFAFSFYLICYARDARFYSFYFLGSCLVLYSIINLFLADLKNKRVFNLWLLMYSLSMVFCMGIHQGSYIFYATANVFLGFFVLIHFYLNRESNNFKENAIDLIIKFLILCIPIFVVVSLLIRMSKGELYNNVSKTNSLLPSLSWNSLRTLQNPFYQLYIYSNKLFLIATIFPVYLFFKKRYKIITLFCVFVKYATFVFLFFLPQSVVLEPLREKYIIYILSIDLLILATGISVLINDLSQLISFINQKHSRQIEKITYLVLSFVILIFFSTKMFPKIMNSSIYQQSRKETKTLAEKLDNVGPNDLIIIFGNYGGVNNLLEYEMRRYPKRKNWNYISNPRSYKEIIPSQNKGYVWFVISESYLNSEGFVDTFWQDKFLSIYKSKKEISNDINKIAVLTAELLKNASSQDGIYKQFYSSIGQNNDLLKEMYVETKSKKNYLDENLILNGSFDDKERFWSFSKALKEDIDYSFDQENNKSFLSLVCPPNKQIGISQNFSVVSGQCYRISASVRSNKNFNGDLLGAYIVVYGPRDNKGQYLVFYDNFKPWTSKSMLFRPNSSGSAVIQIRNGYANIPDTTIADYTDVRIQREIDIDFDSNLLKNANFTNSFCGWSVAKYNNNITIDSEESYNMIKIVNTNGMPSHIAQSFNVVSGSYYNILFSAKKEGVNNKSGALMMLTGFYLDKNKEHYLFMPKLNSNWQYNFLSIKSYRTGVATIYFRTGLDKIEETVFYREIYVNEN